MRLPRALCVFAFAAGARLLADNNPTPSQSPYSANPPYQAAGINQPFPDSIYGADHGGSSITLSYPYMSPFGYVDHSHGVITYSVAPFTPRNSEGVFGMDVWLEQQDGSGNWSVAAMNGGVADQGAVYQPVNTPNPGPSPSYKFTWTFRSTPLPPNTNFRIFVYVYLYNQGGGGQGDFYVASTLGAVNPGTANDAPRVSWTAGSGGINPTQAIAGQTYTISADAQDDNGNLAAVSINKNGLPFAYAGGGNGYSGNSQNPSVDPLGTVTYTAWATDSLGAQSPTITWTVNEVAKYSQSPVSSSNSTLQYYSQPFIPGYHGGSGSGGWQFVIGGYTNWTGAADSNSGTELWPSNAWSANWTPPAPGSYPFWVAKDGDGNYNPSAIAGPYILTVTPSPPTGSFDTVTPTTVAQGQPLGGNGWAADPQMGTPVSSVQILLDNGANGVLAASLGSYRPDVQQANISWANWSPLDLTNSGWSFSYPTNGLGIGTHTVTAIAYDSYGLSTPLQTQTFTVSAPPQPPTATISAVPANGSAPLATTISWTTANASSASITGTGISAISLSGAQAVTLNTPGTYTYTVSASGPGGQVSPSTTVTVSTPQYTVSTFALGNGSVTPGGTYPENTLISLTASPGPGSWFAGWTGSLSSPNNPVEVTVNGNLTLYANFAELQAQTIVFSPPATILFPGPPLVLNATASSGLPVSFTIVSGPATLAGNQLNLTGVGSIVVQATQGGNGEWLAATPVSEIITVNAPPAILRVRFNSTGADALVTPHGSQASASIIWIDPAGLENSPWPSFANPQPAVPAVGSFPLPSVPAAPVLEH